MLADLGAMLLSNISATPSACQALLSLQLPVVPLKGERNPYYCIAGRSGSSEPLPQEKWKGETTMVGAMGLLVQAFIDGARVPTPSSAVKDEKEADRRAFIRWTQKNEMSVCENESEADAPLI